MSQSPQLREANSDPERGRELIEFTETAISAALTTIINLAGWKDIKAITVVNCVSPVAKRPRISACDVKIVGHL